MPVLLLPSLHAMPPAQAYKETVFASCQSHLLLQISKSSAHKTLLFSSGFQQSCPLLHRDALFSQTFLQGTSLPSSQCSPSAELLLVAGCLPLTLLTLSLGGMSSYRQQEYSDSWLASLGIEGASSRTSGNGSLLFFLADRLQIFLQNRKLEGWC